MTQQPKQQEKQLGIQSRANKKSRQGRLYDDGAQEGTRTPTMLLAST